MPFAREADGRISQRFFGAHTYRRTAFAGDYTGLEIQRTLVNRAAQLQVPILDTVYVTQHPRPRQRRLRRLRLRPDDGTRYVIHADAVILAAGGHTRIWRRTSSRRDENTGDSFRLAVDAGGRIRDPELVQFHPSGLIEPENAAGTLVSEAARGEGGILRNALGERFMARYDPERMELSTRDRVALAAYTEIKEGRGTPNGGVWLDVSHLPRETIMRRLPRVYQTLLELQMLDITDDADRDRADRALLDGRRLGAPRGPRHRRRGALRDRRGGERPARREPPRRQLAHRAARVRPDRRRGGRRSTRRTRGAAALGRPRSRAARAEVDELLASDGPENVRALQRAAPRHDDRARRRRARRGRAARRARRARRDRGAHHARRRAPRHRRLPGPRPRLRPEVVGRSPRARRSRPRSSAGRRAAATTAPTTPTLDPPSRSTSSGPAPAPRARARSRRSPTRSPRSCARSRRRESSSSSGAQRTAKLLPGADVELREHLAQVVLDGPRADEQLRADLRVGAARRAASRAICASCAVSSSRVSALRLRTVSPVASSSRRARSANAVGAHAG